jgi:hypothetical protein
VKLRDEGVEGVECDRCAARQINVFVGLREAFLGKETVSPTRQRQAGETGAGAGVQLGHKLTPVAAAVVTLDKLWTNAREACAIDDEDILNGSHTASFQLQDNHLSFDLQI